MNQKYNVNQTNGIYVLFFCLMSLCLLFNSPAWSQTVVSGKVLTSDGMAVASGAVALEQGELHNNAFLTGGAIGPDGSFRISLPSGGPWGLHVYSERYIYFPLQIQVKAGTDNEIPVILPVDGNPNDDPQISNIQFTKISDQVFQITMQVDDPNNNLGPQMLAIDTKRFKSYRLIPEKGDLNDWKANFPRGKYTSPYIPVALDGENLEDWLLVVADHQCSNGPVYNGKGQSVFKPPVPHSEELACDIPGIWKSNFEKVYRFSPQAPGVFKGEQFEGSLRIDKMVQQGDKIFIDFRFEGKQGKGDLKLRCQDKNVFLEGTFSYPDRSGNWNFTKLKNMKAAAKGKDLFMANCSVCHFHDSRDTKVGPGLAGLFNQDQLPKSGKPATEDVVRDQIVNGSGSMPSFKHLKQEEITAIIDYLKSL